MSDCRHVVSHIRNPEQNALSLRCRHCGDAVTVLVDNRPGGLIADGGRPSPFSDPDAFDCPECGIGVYPSMGRCLNCGWESDETADTEDTDRDREADGR